jgi:hypothetical protein
MSARTWIEKTVDTTGRPCPYRDGIPCPGTRKECAFWLDEIIGDGAKTELQGGCAVLYQYTLLHEVVQESVRTQAAMNTATSEIHKSGQVWTRLLQLAAPREVLRELTPGERT